MSGKKKINKKRSNGHMTVARGMAMGGEGSAGPAGCVANGHMTVES